MRPVITIGLALLLASLILPGCVKFADKPPTSATETTTTAASPEAEVKPAPVSSPPAAAPPAMLPLDSPPSTQSGSVARPAAPEEETKEAMEPTPAVQTAALAPPRPETPPKLPAPAPIQAPGTAKAPERAIAVVGDSLAVGIGMTMGQNLQKYAGVGCHPLGKVSTGLISKKFFDWEKKLSELVATEKLVAVVVMMGGNDANNSIGGKMAGTPEWGEAYRQKAESFLKIASAAGVKVLWVGLPVMRDEAYGARVQAVNAAAREACVKVGGCAYMEASDIFTDAAGHYVQAKDIGGKTVPLRGKDGVHMTMTGYDLLCRQVLDRLAKAGALPSGK
jgi:hypothetical protein